MLSDPFLGCEFHIPPANPVENISLPSAADDPKMKLRKLQGKHIVALGWSGINILILSENKCMALKTKEDIVKDWLPRYTGERLSNFGKYILLTNFSDYLQMFANLHGVKVVGQGKPMPCATAEGITMINFGMGSANAATVMDLLSAIAPKAVLFLGKCGGLKKKNQLGDLILPIAAIRGEGTSDDYLPPKVPALPAFQ